MTISEGLCVGIEAFHQTVPSCGGWCIPSGSYAPIWVRLKMSRHHTISYMIVEPTRGTIDGVKFEIGHAMVDKDLTWITEVL